VPVYPDPEPLCQLARILIDVTLKGYLGMSWEEIVGPMMPLKRFYYSYLEMVTYIEWRRDKKNEDEDVKWARVKQSVLDSELFWHSCCLGGSCQKDCADVRLYGEPLYQGLCMPYVNLQHAALNKWSSSDHLEDEICFMVRYEGRQLHNFVIWILSNPRMHTYERHKAEMARLRNWPHLGDCASKGLWYSDYFTKSCRCFAFVDILNRKIQVTGLELNALVLWERALLLASFAFYARIVLLANPQHNSIGPACF
jgi:hypothetical protein